jgi:hypothetical protein
VVALREFPMACICSCLDYGKHSVQVFSTGESIFYHRPKVVGNEL